MRNQAWMIAILVGTATLTDSPALAQSNTSQPIGHIVGKPAAINCQKLPPEPNKVINLSTTASKELEKIRQKQNKVGELLNQKKYRQAIPLTDEILTKLKTSFPNHKRELSRSLSYRGLLYEIQRDDTKVEVMYWEALKALDVVGTEEQRHGIIKDASGRVVKEPHGVIRSTISPQTFSDRFLCKDNLPSYMFLGERVLTHQNQPVSRRGDILEGWAGDVFTNTGKTILFPKESDPEFLISLVNLGTLHSRVYRK